MSGNGIGTHTRRLLLLVLLLWPASGASAQGGRARAIRDLRPTLILVAIDGFRYDYLEKYAPPNLTRLAREGVRARWMTPSFPTKTFPNFYTIATGLRPARHGIVENSIYDRGFGAVFELGARGEVGRGRWWLGEPVWVTAERQGQRAAAFFYPGTEADIAGLRPTYWKTYDGKIPNAARVRGLLSWLDLPAARRPTFLTLYFGDIDSAGHDFGPDAAETRRAVLGIDREVGRLVAGLRARGVFGRVNLVFVSDHGMAAVNRSDAVVLDELFDTALAERILWSYEIVQIFPREGREGEIYETLKSKLPPQASVFRKSELPARLHYSDSPRIAPLLVLPEEGWIVTSRKRLHEMRSKGELRRTKGGHGYDNQLPSMRALFAAHGPAFKRATLVEPFDNTHVYNIITRALNLAPAPNEGDPRVADAVLAR
jgi:predicted AlkP superfamily pyrophosphatase or phosphodiesterase